jgi:hypothetical protein
MEELRLRGGTRERGGSAHGGIGAFAPEDEDRISLPDLDHLIRPSSAESPVVKNRQSAPHAASRQVFQHYRSNFAVRLQSIERPLSLPLT